MCILQPADHHLNVFGQAFERGPGPWLGRQAQNWAQHVTGLLRPELPAARQDRFALREWLPGKSTNDRLLAICAWGGMKVGHGRNMWAAKDDLERDDDLTRTLGALPNLNRREAYTRFRTLRSANGLPGVGPAFFTKLIYFMGQGDGYILDQWTGRSINLLFGPLVHLSPVAGGWRVTDGNSAIHYERYCRCVERLAEMLTANDPSEVESALFAPGPWRDYLQLQVVAHAPLVPFCEEDWRG